MNKNFFDNSLNDDNFKEKYDVEELLEFLDEKNTYYVQDKKAGIIGNKKTGIMIDQRTGKILNDKISRTVNLEDDTVKKGIKYDFLDYKNALNILIESDQKHNKKEERAHEVVKNPQIKSHINFKKKRKVDLKKLKDSSNEDDLSSEKSTKLEEFLTEDIKEITELKVNDSLDVSKSKELDYNIYNDLTSEVFSKKSEEKHKEYPKDFYEELSKKYSDIEEENNFTKENINNKDVIQENLEKNNFKKEFINNLANQTEEELLARINNEFNKVQSEISNDVKSDNNNYADEFVATPFDDLEDTDTSLNLENQIIEDSESINEGTSKEENLFNDVSNFSFPMDLEEYLSVMSSDEEILKSPFDKKKDDEISEVEVVSSNDADDDEDYFSPFDVEEIKKYDNVSSEEMTELGLNQGISKKVSIREVIKKKQKKKQENKELQEKMFFETLDERIEEFKNFKENNMDSDQILNSINMDLTRINSSIKIEFGNINKSRNISKKKKNRETPVSETLSKDDKFSLQTLLEEIYEEDGQEKSFIDTDELDIDRIKRDLAKRESEKKIIN